ncbi:unnamed protein product, partial [Ectocarpus fasciculatus]
LESLQHKGDNFARSIIVERKRLNDLVDAIRHIDDQTEKYRDSAKKAAIEVMNLNILTPNPAYSKADGAEIGKQAQAVTTKTMVVLEAKLNSYLQRKSEKQKNNNKLKQEIDHMRRMRLQTDQSHKNFDAQLRTLREKIASIMGDSTAVVEQREALIDAIHNLERQNAEEQKQFEAEFDEMGRYIQEQNNNLENALVQERKENLKDDVEKKVTRDDSSIEEDIRIAGRVGQLNSFVANEINSSENIKNAIVKYEKMFEQLKKITGSDNVEDVILTYSALEEEMFSMYSYIQTQNAEIESVLEADMKLKADIKEYSKNQAIEDEIRTKSLNKLQNRLKVTKMACGRAEVACLANQEATREIAKKIQNLFFKLQCDQMENPNKNAVTQTGGKSAAGKAAQGNPVRDSKLSMLSGQGATESNVLDYLGAVEHRAVDIIADYLKVSQQSNSMEVTRSPTPGPSSPFHWPMDPFVIPPELHEDAVIGDDDNEAKPVDINHFKERLSRR